MQEVEQKGTLRGKGFESWSEGAHREVDIDFGGGPADGIEQPAGEHSAECIAGHVQRQVQLRARQAAAGQSVGLRREDTQVLQSMDVRQRACVCTSTLEQTL